MYINHGRLTPASSASAVVVAARCSQPFLEEPDRTDSPGTDSLADSLTGELGTVKVPRSLVSRVERRLVRRSGGRRESFGCSLGEFLELPVGDIAAVVCRCGMMCGDGDDMLVEKLAWFAKGRDAFNRACLNGLGEM